MGRPLLVFSAVCAVGMSGEAGAHEPDPVEEAGITSSIVAACPGQAALVASASRDFHEQERRPETLAAYEQLAKCAKAVAIVHVRIGHLQLEARNFAAAEKSYRTAVGLEPNLSNKLGLLEALTRQEKPDADALYAELARYDGNRDDIWANLAYVAFHRNDVPFMRKASAKAIALDTKWWQPWFTAAIAEAFQHSGIRSLEFT